MSPFKFRTTLLLLFFSACFNKGASAEINVVTTIKPLHSIVSNIMSGVSTPKLLMHATISPHDFKLKPSNIINLNKADVIFWIGPSLENKMAKVIQKVAKSISVIELLKSPNLKLLPIKSLSLKLLHSRTTEGSHGHDHSIIDPHIWMSIENAQVIAYEVYKTLALRDKSHRKIYQKNYEKFKIELKLLRTQVQSKVKTISKSAFIVYHDSVQYFEDEYRLHGQGPVITTAKHRPGARRISILRKQIFKENTICIFSEPQYSHKILETITKGSRTQIATLDTIGSTLKPGVKLYGDLMNKVATTMFNCLSKNPF